MLDQLMAIRKEKGLSRKQAASELGVELGTYRNWEQRVNMPRNNEMLKKIADYLEVSMEALLGYDSVEPGAFSDLPEEKDAKFRYVPLVADIAAGIPVEPDEIIDHIPIPNEIMRKHPSAFLLRINGTSMNRVLPNGCYALVDPKRTDVIDNHAYAVKINNTQATAKRVRKLAHGIELVPDSLDPTWKPTICDKDDPKFDEVSIAGEIVWYSVPFDFEI